GLNRLPTIPGSVPPLNRLPAGCPFHPRCPHALPRCAEAMPPVREDGGHRVACWNVTA
ncbi:MAG: ABC transporter ATP-binding protein, partial [Desulfovibrio sp.]|nr:ABC transporter ATP-binding protein [Desulfovibrio sp.]